MKTALINTLAPLAIAALALAIAALPVLYLVKMPETGITAQDRADLITLIQFLGE